jgi:hypothetical protein
VRIYRVRIASDDQGTLQAWAPNAASATSKAAELLHDACGGRVFDKQTDSIALIDFPETKLEIVAWLNFYVDTDNG